MGRHVRTSRRPVFERLWLQVTALAAATGAAGGLAFFVLEKVTHTLSL